MNKPRSGGVSISGDGDQSKLIPAPTQSWTVIAIGYAVFARIGSLGQRPPPASVETCILAAFARIGNMSRMSAALQYPKRHPISVEEYLRMGEGNVFAPDARLELIEGEIIEMAPIGPPHAGTVAILGRLLERAVGDGAIVWVQNPVRIGERSMPQPDVALLKPRADMYTRSHPEPADVLLLIEVSDASLRFDVATKMPLYARAGVIEAWVVDVEKGVVQVFRDPEAAGYRASFTVAGHERLSARAMPAVAITVSELFPK